MFLSENIDLDNVERYNLSIRISPQNFSVLIQDSENAGSFDIQNTAFSSKSTLLANIQRIIFDNSFLTDNFRKVNVVIVSQMYEIIPKSFYEEKYAQKLYNFTHSNKGKHVLTSKLPNGNNRVLFEFDEEVYLFLMRSLYNPLFYHHSSILTEYFEKKIRLIRFK
ncbi:MAG: DUF3822 family protein [Dysgonomonas sp.]